MRAWIVEVARKLLRDEGTGARDRNQISFLFQQLGLLAEAQEISEHTLTLQRQQQPQKSRRFFGLLKAKETDPDVAQTYGNMANVYNQQGDYAKALDYYEKALSIKLKALGQEHPRVEQDSQYYTYL